MMRVILLTAIMVASLQSVTVVAQPQNRGLQLAEKLCARCHAIGHGKVGRHPRALAFTEIASRYSVWGLQEALAEGIVVGHAEMPKFVLSPKDINALLTYMDGLKPQKRPTE